MNGYEQVGSEIAAITAPCNVASTAALVALTCSSFPTCASTGCSCGTCPISRAQLGSTAAGTYASTVTILRRGSTYANPVVLNLYPAFTLASTVYPDGGTGGAAGTVTLVGATPSASCTNAGSGYSTLPTSASIGQSLTGAVQPSTCSSVTLTIAAGTANSGTVTVTAGGSAAGCLGGTYNVLFIGGSGTLTPGTCTVTFGAGTHTAAISPVGAGYPSAPTVVFQTGAQARGCLVLSLGGFTPASGAIPAAPTPTTTPSTVSGCLLGVTAAISFSAPVITPAAGTYLIPGLAPAFTGFTLATDTGSGYTVDLNHLTLSITPAVASSCAITASASAGTNAGTLKITLSGASVMTSVGCLPGTYTLSYIYSGVASKTSPGASTFAVGNPAVTYTGTCTSMPCTTASGTASPGDSVVLTIAPATLNGVSVSFPSGCITFGAVTNSNTATTGTFTISISSGPTLASCIIGTWVATLGYAPGNTGPGNSSAVGSTFSIVVTGAAVTFGGALTSATTDNLGAGFTVLPLISLGSETTTGLVQPATCALVLTATIGSAAGKIQVGSSGVSSALGLGCLIGTYTITFTQQSGGLGTPPAATVTFASGTIQVSLSSVGANYPARPRVMMAGQPNTCLATADTGLTFTASTGALASGTATFGGSMTGCLIFNPAAATSLDISPGAMDPAAGYYTISAGALTAIQVIAPGFGYAAFPTPGLAPTGTDGQAAACTLTALTTTTSTLTTISGATVSAPVSLAGAGSVPTSLSGCITGAFSIVFTKPQTFSLSITADTPFPASSLSYNDMLLVGQEVVRIAGACSSATPPVCPVIRGQQFTTPMLHSSAAKVVRLRRSPAPYATPAISFTLLSGSIIGSTSLSLSATGNTWFPPASLAIGDTLLVRTVIVECAAVSCATISRPMGATVDVALSAGDEAWLLPATSISFTLTAALGILGDGLLDSLSMISNQPGWPTINSGDMLLINSEVVQVNANCAASPCTIARAKGGTALATAAIGDRAVLVRRVNGDSLTGQITFTVSNALGLGVSDSTVTLSAATDFAVTSLATNDVLLAAAEFLVVSGPCFTAGTTGVCPVFRGQTYGGYGGTVSGATLASGTVVTLVRRPTSPPPSSSEVMFSVAASFSAWGLLGLGYCPGSALTGCGQSAGCKGTCPSTPTFGQTLLSLTADGPYSVAMLGEHELLMLGTELVRLTGPCHAYGCPVRRAQQYSEYTTQSLSYANRQAKATLVTASAITFTLSSSLATTVNSVSLTPDTAVNPASLAPNTLLLIGTEVVRVASGGCTSTSCTIVRAQLTPTGWATADPGTTYAAGTKATLLDQALQRGYSAATGVQVNLAYLPLPAAATSKAFTGGSGVATYSIDRCDPTAVPASREAPIQIIVGNEYLKAPGSNYGGSYTYDTQTGGNAFWVDGNTATSFTTGGDGAAGGGSIVEIKGWDMLPSDIDLAYDGPVTFTLYSAVLTATTSFALTASVESFPVQSLLPGDYLLVGTEIVEVTAAASAGSSLVTAATISVLRGIAGTVAATAGYAAGTRMMLMPRPFNGLSAGLKTFTITAAAVDAQSITFTSSGTLRQGDLLLAPTIGEVIRITSASCVTSCQVARGQPTPLGQETASGLTGTSLIFIKRPVTLASGPITFTLATQPLLLSDTTITLTAAADPITFKVVSGPDGVAAATATDTLLVLSADTSFAISSLAVGDLLLVGTEIIAVVTPSGPSRPTLVTVARAQIDANGVATTAVTITANTEALLLDAAFRPRRLLGLPRTGFTVGALSEGDVLAVAGEMMRVMGPCGLNGASKAPVAVDVCPVQRAYLGTTAASVTAGPAVQVLLMQRSTTDGDKVTRTDNYVLVTVGQRPLECANAWASAPCSPGRTSAQEQRLQCSIREVRKGFCANDFSRACRCRDGVMCADCVSSAVCRNSIPAGTDHTWPYRAKPSLRCVLPPALGPDQNLNIYLHGIKTTLTDWYHPDPPVVTGLSPASASYQGGDTVTVLGRNFGPQVSWTRQTAGGAQTLEKAQARVELLGRAVALTCDTTYVSDSQLLCKVPPLPQQRQPVDTNARTVAVDVVVRTLGRRSARGPQASLLYSNVPAFYMCPNSGTAAQDRSDCYSCCSSACTVDQFALGTDAASAAPTFCGASCSAYCGGGAAAWMASGRPRMWQRPSLAGSGSAGGSWGGGRLSGWRGGAAAASGGGGASGWGGASGGGGASGWSGSSGWGAS